MHNSLEELRMGMYTLAVDIFTRAHSLYGREKDQWKTSLFSITKTYQ